MIRVKGNLFIGSTLTKAVSILTIFKSRVVHFTNRENEMSKGSRMRGDH